MKLLYSMDDEDKKNKVHFGGQDNILAIKTNILQNLQELVKVCPFYYPLEDKSIDPKKVAEFIGLKHPMSMASFKDPALLELMERIWEDEGIQKTWDEHRHLIQIQDALPHFMNKFHVIFSDDYSPSEEDWLRVRVRTSGITETHFQLEGVKFRVVDVGGQRSERKKWLHCFSDVTAIIYVSALSEYDQYLFEDSEKNRMMESLEVFGETVKSPSLRKIHWILFLNKSDLFREKLNRSPIRHIDDKNPMKTRFVDFDGPYCPKDEPENTEAYSAAYEAALEYFRSNFVAKTETPGRIVCQHVTCAMDQHNVHVVFHSVKAIVINQLMGQHGIITTEI